MVKSVACIHPLSSMDPNSDKNGICKTILHACCRDGHLTKSSLLTLRKILPSEDECAALILSEMDHHGDMNMKKLLRIPEYRACSFPYQRNGVKMDKTTDH
jgi:hypothetical protein